MYFPAAVPGIGKVDKSVASLGLPVLGSVTAPTSQPLPTMVATWPCAMTASWVDSSSVAPPVE